MALSDEELLRQYTSDGSNAAFAELVGRYLSLVYSAARRQVQLSALAEDIAQSVFIDLSKNAGKLKPGQPLAAWLYLVTRRTAVDVIRRESRRQIREQSASEIAAMTSYSSPWTQVEPLLDEALETLSEADRQALLLRYFASKSLREVGETLGTSEDAAQKRISRALEQLRTVFARRGIAITAAGLATDLSAHVVLSVPTGLGATISASALSAGVLAQTAHTITMTTLNKTLVATAVVLVASIVYEAHLLSTGRNQLVELEQAIAAQQLQAQQLQDERDRATALLAKAREELDAERALANERAVVEADLEAWLERVNQLKTYLDKKPEKRIPEMRFLTSGDWLSATLYNKLQTENKVRMALGGLRQIAKMKPEIFFNLTKALDAYRKDHDGASPTDTTLLRPYLHPLLDDDILQRYDCVPEALSPVDKKAAPDAGTRYVLLEKPPVDEDYDSRYKYSEQSMGFQLVSKLGDQINEATKAFMQANAGQAPTELEQLRPFFTGPVDETRIKDFWEARHQ